LPGATSENIKKSYFSEETASRVTQKKKAGSGGAKRVVQVRKARVLEKRVTFVGIAQKVVDKKNDPKKKGLPRERSDLRKSEAVSDFGPSRKKTNKTSDPRRGTVAQAKKKKSGAKGDDLCPPVGSGGRSLTVKGL